MKIDWTLKSALDYTFIAELELEVYGHVFSHDGAPDSMRLTASITLDGEKNSLIVRASARDYAQWLRGYVKSGGKITHRCDYPMRNARFFYAFGDVTVNSRKEYGARSRNIIVHPGAKVTRTHPGSAFSGWGHTSVYWMEGYKTSDTGIVPVFSDPEFNEFQFNEFRKFKPLNK